MSWSYTLEENDVSRKRETELQATRDDRVVQEPIAVCGLSLKFPQDASSEEAFWTMLMEKRSGMTEFPPERMNISAFHHPTRPNALRTRGAHFIKEDVGLFDADFFSITPSEAAALDPMQRILLETTFHAFESAGIALEDVRGSRSSVHTGCFSNDYLQQTLKDSERLPSYAAVGASQSMLANRLSWFYDLRGPSVNLDSACSSSAMAVDLSCQLLRNGTTNMGVVAGCNLLLDPDYTAILSNMQMLSPDGLCYAFDHRANGYSRGEGVAVIVLKRLSDALRDNDSIRALIRASGTNQDGRTPGITQPDANAQALLIRETYERAGLSMKHTRFFEAHGTGTELGDPVEISAIADVFAEHRNAADPLHVGSVKTNIGHLEGASGIAGLIKAILVVESGIIPPNANFESINRKLASYDHVISLPSARTTWPFCDVRRASTNSFGYGGTNCHIVVDDVCSYLRRKGLVGNQRTTNVDQKKEPSTANGFLHSKTQSWGLLTDINYPKLLVWSGSTQTATRVMISSWQPYSLNLIRTTNTVAISDIAYTLDSRRSLLPFRSMAVISEPSDLQDLEQLATTPRENTKQLPQVAFVFTGQGAQWYAMGRELFAYPVFVQGIQVSESILAEFGCSWSIRVLQMGLVDLFDSFNVTPVAVVGHSMGEIAAAYCAGFLTRRSALRLAYYRGFFTSRISERSTFTGAMLAVGLSADQVSPYLAVVTSEIKCKSSTMSLVISCINSPRSTTISGEEFQVKRLKHMLDEKGVFNRRLRVPVAYHSPQMELIASDCLRNFGSLQSSKNARTIKMVSSVTGDLLSRDRACEGSYWVSNLVSPVLFSKAVERLCRDRFRPLSKKLDGSHREAFAVDNLIEIGPHAALRLPIRENLDSFPREDDIKYLSALNRKQSASCSLLRVLGELHCSGLPINLRVVNDSDPSLRNSRRSLTDSPKYPFDHSTRYWSESPLVKNYRMRTHGYTELLGSPSRDWNPLEPQWRCCVQVSNMPWLLEHKLSETTIYPAAASIVMSVQGVLQLSKNNHSVSGFTLRNVRYESAIEVSPDSKELETRLQLRPCQSNTRAQTVWGFSVFSVAAGHWSESCRGTIEVHYDSETSHEEGVDQSRYYHDLLERRNARCTQVFDSSVIYDNFSKHGFHYGPTFQGITTVRHNGIKTVTADLSLGTPQIHSCTSDDFVVHPATLDSFLQVALVALSKGEKSIPTQAISSISKLWISAKGLRPKYQTILASAKFESGTSRYKQYSGFALSGDGEHVRLSLHGLETTVVSAPERSYEAPGDRQFWYTMQTAVDVNTFTGSQILDHLESKCGPNPLGPSDFFRDLRRFLWAKVRELYDIIEATGTDTKKPYLQRYVHWMQSHLRNPTDVPLLMDSNSLRRKIENQGFLGDFFLKVADNVLDVLQGRCDMVQLLFEHSLVDNFYEQQLSDSVYYRKLQAYLQDLTFQYPTMDFLEIGAGTGSFTEHILKAVSSSSTGTKESYNSYCFTDISTAFYERARNRFSQHLHKMDFALLDANQDPLTQGFNAHSFDIISASNVLHVTRDLDRTLQSIRMLLKPGGKLLLHEYIRPSRIEVGFVFGLLPGWWPSTDESRLMSPLLTEEMWNALLRRNGFSGADFILRDFADEESHLMSIMCATVTETTSNDVLPEITLVIESDSALQRDMADKLVTRLNAESFPQVRVIDLYRTREDKASLGVVVALFDFESAILSRLEDSSFNSLKSLLLSSSRVLWVSKEGTLSEGPNFGLINGFAKVFRIENINAKFATLVLEKNQNITTSDLNSVLLALMRLLKTTALDQSEDYIVKDGNLHISRISEDFQFKKKMCENISGRSQVVKSVRDSRPFNLSFNQLESHEGACITEVASNFEALGEEEVEIEVRAIGINPTDVAIMSGKTTNLNVGRECAGVVTRLGSRCSFLPGDRVCAYGTEMLNSTSRTNRELVAKIPQTMSFEEASTLPQDYLIANYLVQEARIGTRDVVLVRGGQTRLGRAMLHILNSSKLLDTASPKEDKSRLNTLFTGTGFLIASYPIRASLVFDFLDTNIHQLNEHVSRFGQIYKVTEGGSVQNSDIELPPTIGVRVMDVAEILKHRSDRLQMSFSELHDTHVFPVKTVMLSEVASTVRDLKLGERMAVKIDDLDQIAVYRSNVNEPLFGPTSSYVISGGLGDLGRCVATWMVKRGARNLILLSRSGPSTEAAKATVRDLEGLGAKIRTPLCDVTDVKSLQYALQDCRDMPAVKGCVQASGALKDIMYDKMSFQDWRVAVDPKVYGSWNLHELLPKGMDFFILTSSITGIMGQATQINYAAGNTYQDALAQYRVSVGEKAVSLDLGILLTGGLLSHNHGLSERLAAENVYSPLSEPEILAQFEHFCDPHLAMGMAPPQVVSGIIRPSLQNSQARTFPLAFSHPFWRQTLVQTGNIRNLESDSADAIGAGPSMAQAKSTAEASETAARALADQFCCLALIPKARLNLEEPLHTAGADSLSAVYLRNWIMKQFGVDVAVFDILGDMSIAALGHIIAKEWWALQER